MPPTPEPPSHIAIKVKVPPGYLSTTDNTSGTDSFLLGSEIPVTSNVGALRLQIQQLIPTHPAPERQRLLYGGRALVDNEQRLGDAFNVKRDPTQTEYVVHLLVKGEQGVGDAGQAHRRAVSTPPAQTPGGQQQTHAQALRGSDGQPMGSFARAGPPFMPGGAPFPQIIARNQQLRAERGMQGIGGHQAGGQMEQNTGNSEMGQQDQQAGQNAQQSQQGQQPGSTGQGQPGQQHPHAPGRPISGQGFHMQGVGPNGQRFQIHHQMTQFPIGGAAAGHMPHGFPAMPHIPGMMPGPGFGPQHLGHGRGAPPQIHGPSALDRARENMTEMRRLLDEMRSQHGTSDEQQRRIDEVQQRAQSINEYIDPFQLGNANGSANEQRSAANPTDAATTRTSLPPPFQQGLPPLHNVPRRPAVPMPMHAPQALQRPSNPNEVTAYLLSSPQGPQALLFSPQHGAYTGTLAQNIRPQPTPTTTLNQQPQQPSQEAQQDPVARAAAQAAQELQVQHAQLHAAQANQQAQAGQDPLGPMQALLAHFWLLLRVLIFAWFLLGSNMGWQRPAALLAIGLGFWMVRAGALGDGAAVRRWWEGVVGVEPPRPAHGGQQPAQGQGAPQQQGVEGQAPAEGQQQQQRGTMPTPEQVAQRLLDEQADRTRQQNAWWRERIRPAERAVALFVASLWPGVGEATVRARREMEERARAEEEVEAARRREEEENAKAEKEGQVSEEGVGVTEKEKGESSAVAAEGEGGEGLRERKAPGEEAQATASSSSS